MENKRWSGLWSEPQDDNSTYGEKLIEGDTIYLLGVEGTVSYECGAWGWGSPKYVPWEQLEEKIPHNNSPYFCYCDNFVSFWELKWNFDDGYDWDGVPFISHKKPDGGIGMTDEQKCLEWLKHRRDNTPMAGAKKMFSIAISALEKQERDKWIPFKCRKATEDDGTSFDYIMEGHLPEDGQTILITIKPDGHEPVQVDTYYDGGGEECYLDSGYSLCDEAIAWRPLPEPYTEEES